jgi:hypothetical protein
VKQRRNCCAIDPMRENRKHPPDRPTRLFQLFCTLLYAAVSIVLMGIAITLIAYAVWQAVVAISSYERAVPAMLAAIGLIVISIAGLDVGKYLMEEEVLRDRELRSAIEARQTLTKFMVIICIAVSLESVVQIAKVDDAHLQNLVYPAVLLLSAVGVMVGLGIYQKLSAAIEIKDDDSPPPQSGAEKITSD